MTTHLQRLSLLVLMGVVACIHATWCHAAGTATSQDDVLWQMAVREQAELEQSRVHLEDAVLGEYVRTLVMRLWKEAQSDLVPMQVRALVDSTANASVYPNGVCYLTSGMLAVTQNQDQLAMILAHEMIHYIRRHSLAVHSRFSGSATPSIGRDMSEARLVQAAEKQADVEGVALMRKAGFCAGEAVAVISRSLASIPLRNPSQPVEPPAGDAAVQRIQWVRDVLESSGAGVACSWDASAGADYSLRIAVALLADARLAAQRGLWSVAAEDIERYLTVQPTDPRAHFLYGEVQRQRPASESTVSPEAAYLEAIHLDKQFGPAYQALGVLHFKAGRKAEARPFFEKCLVLAPQSEESAYIRRYLQLCSP
jgi:tetratricopeptide (TPR) repeat protein